MTRRRPTPEELFAVLDEEEVLGSNAAGGDELLSGDLDRSQGPAFEEAWLSGDLDRPDGLARAFGDGMLGGDLDRPPGVVASSGDGGAGPVPLFGRPVRRRNAPMMIAAGLGAAVVIALEAHAGVGGQAQVPPVSRPGLAGETVTSQPRLRPGHRAGRVRAERPARVRSASTRDAGQARAAVAQPPREQRPPVVAGAQREPTTSEFGFER